LFGGGKKGGFLSGRECGVPLDRLVVVVVVVVVAVPAGVLL
jgi:hypothetical protein